MINSHSCIYSLFLVWMILDTDKQHNYSLPNLFSESLVHNNIIYFRIEWKKIIEFNLLYRDFLAHCYHYEIPVENGTKVNTQCRVHSALCTLIHKHFHIDQKIVCIHYLGTKNIQTGLVIELTMRDFNSIQNIEANTSYILLNFSYR